MLSSNLKLVYAPSLSFLWPVILRKRTWLTSAPPLSKMFLHLPPPFHVPSFPRQPRFLWSWNVIMWHVSMTLWICHHLLSHVWLFDSMDCSPPGSPVHGILQARIPECVAMPSSRESNHYMQTKVYVDKYIKKSFSQREVFISKIGVLHKIIPHVFFTENSFFWSRNKTHMFYRHT